MEKRWSSGILHTVAAVAPDDDDDSLLLPLLLLLSAMGGRQEGPSERLSEQPDCGLSATLSPFFTATCWATDWSVSLLLFWWWWGATAVPTGTLLGAGRGEGSLVFFFSFLLPLIPKLL